MKHTSLVKRLNKLNITVLNAERNNFYAKHNKKVISWIKQEDSALFVNVYKENDAPDRVIDYNPAYIASTIKKAIEHLTK